MVRIRLRRMGAKKKPFYRIVVADQHSPRDGRFIETIGTYDPLTDPATVELKNERVIYWLSVGAQPSEAVAHLFKKLNLMDAAGKPVSQPESSEVQSSEVQSSEVENQAAAV